MTMFPGWVGSYLAAHESKKALFPGDKADVPFPERLGVNVSVSYERRGFKVIESLAKERERVHHAAK